jgi:hypothetical protein
MNRTRWIFVLIVGAALVIVATAIGLPMLQNSNAGGRQATGQAIEVRIVTALAVEPWVRAAANQFNAEAPTLEGRPIRVTITPMDGLAALSKWDREEFFVLGDRDRETLSED